MWVCKNYVYSWALDQCENLLVKPNDRRSAVHCKYTTFLCATPHQENCMWVFQHPWNRKRLDLDEKLFIMITYWFNKTYIKTLRNFLSRAFELQKIHLSPLHPSSILSLRTSVSRIVRILEQRCSTQRFTIAECKELFGRWKQYHFLREIATLKRVRYRTYKWFVNFARSKLFFISPQKSKVSFWSVTTTDKGGRNVGLYSI